MSTRGVNAQNFGKYIIERQLAEGGMAKVFLGRTKNNYGIVKPVAIKIMQKAYIHNARLEKMFLHEASLAVQFNHQNVLGILDYGSMQGQCYVVMDFISGCSLLDFRQQAQRDFDGIPYAEVLFIAKNITAGLDYAHRLKDSKTGVPLQLVHRDISPHNIMISREGDIKIIDFGVAKTADKDEHVTLNPNMTRVFFRLTPAN